MFEDVKEEWKTKNTICFVDSDLDGTSCRLIFEYHLYDYDNVRLIQSSATEIPSLLHEFDFSNVDVVVFADLTPPVQWYKSALQEFEAVFIFDHHISAYEVLKEFENPNYNFDLNRCSAKIVFDWFNVHNPAMDEYVSLVDVYDRYLDSHEKFDYARGINNLLFWYVRESRWKGKAGYDKFVSAQSRKFQVWNKFKFHQYEQVEIDNEYEKEKESIKRAKKTFTTRVDAFGNLYGYFELGAKISYVCSEMLRMHPDIQYVVCHNTFEKEIFKFSIRSKGFDVTKIAGAYKGGGHTMASGFSTADSKLGNAILDDKHKLGVCYFKNSKRPLIFV